MQPSLQLSPEQLDFYDREGYIVLGRVLDDAQLEDLRREEARFRGECSPNELTVFRSQVSHFSEPVRRFCLNGAHLDVVNQLVGPNICFWFNQFVTKRPDANSGKSEFPWHQDNGYVSIEPATNVTVWIALDDVDEENGCVWVLPKSHRSGLLSHQLKSEDSWHLEVPVDGDGVPAILKAGEAVAFSGLTLHRSKLNHTDNLRRAFFMEYCDAKATFAETNNPDFERRSVVLSGQSWLVSGELPYPIPQPLPLY